MLLQAIAVDAANYTNRDSSVPAYINEERMDLTCDESKI
jgi:hypothetical protein